jgi:hypothetical protein
MPARIVRAGIGQSIFLGEIFLSGSADGAGPVVRDVFELGSGSDAAVRVADGRVINIAAESANVFIHVGYLLLVFDFPVSVQVAVFAGRDFFRSDAEFGFRGLAGAEILTVDLAVGNKFDPFNIMSVEHRMGDFADHDLVSSGGFVDDRDVFFPGCVHGPFNLKLHVLTATDQGSSAAMHHFYDISTQFTFVHFESLSHFFLHVRGMNISEYIPWNGSLFQ